ncbi:hypothetical protein SN811_01350 [Ligilactobacillus agilis]|uniref:YopX protein domain-containing protein n=1 Tax=Ligilactobacillus agilis TaxID=1601 RepID=A0A6F9Y2L7_9LACO|nr:hypothetical protein [Ligilactobacillus agilis]GET11635.1 hypothetical protein SN811_01350 [Ligilactobacillus agilis]
MNDYNVGDFFTDGNALLQIVSIKERLALVEVNKGVAIIGSNTESGLVRTYESLYDCYLQRVTKEYAAAYIGGPNREFTNGTYYVKLNGAYLGERTEHGYELVTDKRYINYFKGPDAYEMAFWCKNRFGGKVIRVNELEVDYVPNASLFDDEEDDEEEGY